MTVKTDLALRITSTEEVATDLGTSKATHALEMVEYYPDGAAPGSFDVIYSATATATAAPDRYDVLGDLNSPLAGPKLSFATLCGIVIKNLSTTATENLIIGGGANAAIPAQQPLGPAGIYVWFDPIDGITPVAGTGDLIQIDPSANTINYHIILLGRSA